MPKLIFFQKTLTQLLSTDYRALELEGSGGTQDFSVTLPYICSFLTVEPELHQLHTNNL